MEGVDSLDGGDEYPVPIVVAIALVGQNKVVDDGMASWQITFEIVLVCGS
mgnify:CR=1 FL=1